MIKLIYGFLLLTQFIFIVARPPTLFGLAISVYTIAFWAASLDFFFVANYSFTNYLFVAFSLFAVYMHCRREGASDIFKLGAATYCFLGLYAFSWFSALWSIDPQLTISKQTDAAPRLIAFAMLVPLVFSTPRRSHIGLLFALALGSVVAWLYFTFAYTSGRFIITAGGVERIGNPLAVASLGGSIAILASMLTIPKVGFFLIPVRIILIVMGMSLIVYVDTRGQLLAALGAIFIASPFAYGGRNWKALFQKVFLPIIFLVPVLYVVVEVTQSKERFNLTTLHETYQSSRLVFAEDALDFWSSQGPIAFFVGIGSSGCTSPQVLGTYPHLVAVEVLVELGLIGFALWLTALILGALAAIRLLRKFIDDPVSRSVLAAIIGLTLFNFALTFKQGTVFTNVELWMCIIILSRLDAISRANPNSPIAAPPQPLHRGQF
ncbi:MAG: hypothetical protein AAF986_03615 [Pseudomonadota bacterium]